MIGTIAELRRVGDNYGADAVIRALVDDDARMLFTSRGSGQWVSLRGRPVAAPFTLPGVDDRAVRIDVPGGSGMFVVQSVIADDALAGRALSSRSRSVLRRPHDFLRRLLVAGLFVLALATVGAWFLGRLVTRPLREVTSAARRTSRRATTRGASTCAAEDARWRVSRRCSTRWPRPPATRTPCSPSGMRSSSARTRRRRSSSP